MINSRIIIKNDELKAKITKLERYYKEKHTNFDEKKMEKYISNKLKKEIKELIQLNINPAIEMINSENTF